MLKSSLRELAINFNCETLKGFLSYSFIDISKIDYKGECPNMEDFPDITLKEYNKLDKTNFYVKNETLKYLKADLLSLYQVMIKFAKLIFEDYGLCITNIKTISALSLQVYLSNYYKNNFNISVIKGFIDKEIRKG